MDIRSWLRLNRVSFICWLQVVKITSFDRATLESSVPAPNKTVLVPRMPKRPVFEFGSRLRGDYDGESRRCMLRIRPLVWVVNKKSGRQFYLPLTIFTIKIWVMLIIFKFLRYCIRLNSLHDKPPQMFEKCSTLCSRRPKDLSNK